MEKADREFQKTRDTHIKKFESLERRSQKKKGNSLPVETIVINRSNIPLTKDKTSVLAKGLNYAIAPKKVPKEEIICEVEAAVRGMPTLKAEEIRQEVTRVLKSAKPPKSNLTVGEKKALRSIKEKSEIVVLPADKGNATVVMDRKEYDDKMLNLLHPATYRKIKNPQTKS
ncbi:uncharacterized protein [Onthophagus taurus]|uniref:uncharacterized protein n=1 Tax=Onthophagus taurus TaxID=166361 RepID=UPI0039BDCF59